MDFRSLIELVVASDDTNIDRTVRFIRCDNNIALLYFIAESQQDASPSSNCAGLGVREHLVQLRFETLSTSWNFFEVTNVVPADADESFID